MRGSAASRERPGGPAARGRTVTARGNRRGAVAKREGHARMHMYSGSAGRAGHGTDSEAAVPGGPVPGCARSRARRTDAGVRRRGTRGGRRACAWLRHGRRTDVPGGPGASAGPVAPAGPAPSRGRRLGRAAASGGMCGGAAGCPRPGSPGRRARPGRLLGRDGRADGVRGPRRGRARAARRLRGRRRPVCDGPSGPGAPGAGAERCAAPAGPGRGRPVAGDRRPYGWRRYTGEACGRSYGRRTCGGSAPHLVPASRRAVMVARRSPW